MTREIEESSPFVRRRAVRAILKRIMIGFGGLGEKVYFSLRSAPKPSSAILLVGSGRSGTTWLTNILTASPGIQQIFEPLNPVWIEQARKLTGWDRTPFYPRSFYLRAETDDPQWNAFLERVLRGQVRSFWTDYERTSYFPNRFLIKFIRANLMLGYIYDKFQPRMVYISRHPCATVYSRLALGWQADVADILRQEALVEDYLRPWVSQMERERTRVGAAAIWWAVENMVARQELATRPHIAVTHEELCLEPQQQTERLFAWLGIKMPAKLSAVIERPSRQSRQGVTYRSTMERLSYWKKQLHPDEQRCILDWANRLGVTQCNDDIPFQARNPRS